MPRYACEPGCGACCKGHLIVECDDLDVQREPRLIEVDQWHAGKPAYEVVKGIREEWKAVILPGPCPFLDGQSRCDVYPTRPNACVAFEPGSESCQEVRAAENMPPLAPVAETPVAP